MALLVLIGLLLPTCLAPRLLAPQFSSRVHVLHENANDYLSQAGYPSEIIKIMDDQWKNDSFSRKAKYEAHNYYSGTSRGIRAVIIERVPSYVTMYLYLRLTVLWDYSSNPLIAAKDWVEISVLDSHGKAALGIPEGWIIPFAITPSLYQVMGAQKNAYVESSDYRFNNGVVSVGHDIIRCFSVDGVWQKTVLNRGRVSMIIARKYDDLPDVLQELRILTAYRRRVIPFSSNSAPEPFTSSMGYVTQQVETILAFTVDSQAK